MGKRVSGASNVDNHHHHHHRDLTSPPARSIRKRKRISLNVAAAASVGKALRLGGNSHNSNYWHENDDEDSSSNDATVTPPAQQHLGRNGQSTKQANNSSILLNTSLGTVLDASLNESPKPVYTLMPSVVNGTILHDLTQKPWRLGRPIGKGNFGEIFLASNNITVPVTNENAKFVVKIEPHSNGPLFVEIHCLINTAKKNVDDANNKTQVGTQASAGLAAALSQNPPSGIPDYIASGSHYFGDARYRFLVLQRFDRDLHSLIRNCRVSQKSVLTLAIQIVNVLENLHDKGYCHNDVKAQNLMISKCKYYKKEKRTTTNGANGIKGGKSGGTTKDKYSVDHDYEKQQTTDSGNSSEQDGANDDDDDDDDDEEDARDFVIKSKTRKYNKYKNDDDDDDEDFDDGATSQSNNSNSMDIYETPVNNNRKRRQRTNVVEYSGSNPVRSCRRQQRNSTYEEMVKSHYLRPTKRISYSEFFNEETTMKGSDMPGMHLMSSDDESEEFLPQGTRRTTFSKNKSLSSSKSSIKRLTRRQEKLAAKQQQHQQQNNHQQTTTPAISTRMVAVEEERIFLIDFGLASKFMDNGVHRPFVMDQRRAHDGTLEFTSRDAHMGAHSRRSDLECLGYNLVYWSQGFLPWKDAAMQHQQEKVHRAKEYLMTDVREMLKQIYGKQVPKYLGEFLHHVGQLAYHERPDYARYRRLFENEYQTLGYALEDMHLDGNEIMRTCVRFKEEIENKKDIFEMNKLNVLSIMKNLTTVGTPFQESTLSNRVSPKNLRSKSTKKGTKKKKFSWAEILSQDPDQIARERAEKEFDREEESCDMQHPRVRRYTGKPTYAILEVQRRMRMNGRMIENHDEEEEEQQRQKQQQQQQKKRVYENTVKEEDDEHDEDDDDNDEEEEEEEEEEDDNSDSDNAEDNYSQKEDEDTETDASEVSDHTPQNYGRSKRMAKCVTTTRKTSKTANTRARATVGRKRMPATTNNSSSSTTTTNDESSMKTRTRSCTAVTNKTSVISAAFGKRGGCATRGYGRSVINVASAAGEEHNNAAKYHHYDTSNGTSAAAAYERPVVERRTRRCLIKTDAADEVTRDGDESNSNLSPDMHGLFNVWKKINNESIYFKGRAAASASAKHFKK